MKPEEQPIQIVTYTDIHKVDQLEEFPIVYVIFRAWDCS
jgi:hypothetical protein